MSDAPPAPNGEGGEEPTGPQPAQQSKRLQQTQAQVTSLLNIQYNFNKT